MEFRDLKTQYKKNRHAINASIKNVLKEGVFIGGKPVEELESILADYVGTKYCISCANGTDALTLVLMAWGIGKGDAVFVPDFTFFATAEAPAFLGATPIFVDVNEDTFNMCPDSLEKAIKTVIQENKLNPKVVIPVDLFGLPADYDRIIPIAKKYDLLVLEDAAQGFGGSIRERKAGSFGNAAITSFFPAKPLGCYGDGGAIFTNDKRLSEIISSLKVHGKGTNKYDNIYIGMNSRLDTIQAAILLVKYRLFKSELIRINEYAKIYNNKINNSKFKIPIIPKDYISSYAQYTIRFNEEKDLSNAIRSFEDNEIPYYIYYPKMLSQQKAFTNSNQKFSNPENLINKVFSIPIHPYMKSRDINKVVKLLNQI